MMADGTNIWQSSLKIVIIYAISFDAANGAEITSPLRNEEGI